ncbi:MAG: hypothetical protein CMJ62_04095 [Planctomycetaceae bacterium]|nr:hypothetical protein [Planctomycetaceae bacterium]
MSTSRPYTFPGRQLCANGVVAFPAMKCISDMTKVLLILAIPIGFVWTPSQGLAAQLPVYLTFDVHVDPVGNGLPFTGRQAVYQERTDNIVWVLDQTESLDIPISFLSAGWYMEMLVDEGASGEGAAVLEQLYDRGGQIGSHSHAEYQAGSFDWPSFTGTPTLSESRRSWQDNIDWVNRGIETAFGGSPPRPVEEINNIKGAHLPKTEADYHTLMDEFGFRVREPGPEEDYYGYYGHHIWNPFRPATENAMAEDLSAPFVQVVSGPVIGKESIHHGTLQDMTAESVKRQFLQLYINWRHADRSGAPEKVWAWGWGGHAHDFSPGSDSRTDLLDVLGWLEEHFRDRVEPTGSQAMLYATEVQTGEAYEAWETDHPGESSFSFESLSVDWDEYPYLAPVATAMRDYLWEADLELGADIDAFQLDKSGDEVVVLWRESGFSSVDLSEVFSTTVDVLGLETGVVYGSEVNAANVLVGGEPLFVSRHRSTVPEPCSWGLLALAAGLALATPAGSGARSRAADPKAGPPANPPTS